MRRSKHTHLGLAIAALLATSQALAAPPARLAPDARDRSPAAQLEDADLLRAPDGLEPGEFEWQPGWDAGDGAPVTLMVNLAEQRAYVFRDGRRIGVSTVSSGKPGHDTPTGVFEILQKKKMHYSNLYEDPRNGRPAAMPWMQRLTWDGVALHAGRVRAQPASHGCVRLPPAFAEQLYGITRKGALVVIAQDGSIDALARAGVEAPLALLLSSASSLREIARKFVADQPGAGASSREGALSP